MRLTTRPKKKHMPVTTAIIHMLYCRFLKCVLLNFGSNVGQRCRYLHAYVLQLSVGCNKFRTMENILIIILLVLILIIWFWAIIDINRFRFSSQKANTIWLLIVFLFPLVGSILYFKLKRKYVIPKPRKFQPKFKHVESKLSQSSS